MRRLLPLLALSFAAVAQAQPPAQGPAPRVVQVTGQGETTVAPDRAQLSMAIEARNAELATAERSVNDSTRAALAALKGLGLKDDDISTASYAVNPEYDWVDNRQVFRGYFARREITLTLRDLAKMGDVMLKLTKAGVNQINPPVLQSSKLKQVERGALAAAMDDAVGQARVVAESLTMKLGPVRSVNVGGSAVPPPSPEPRVMMMKASADAAGMSGNEQTGFSAGVIRVESRVSAEFELLAAPAP